MAETISRKEIAGVIAEKHEKVAKSTVEKIVNEVFDEIITSVKAGKSVQIFGFGSFNQIERKARTGVNPRTGDKIKIAAKKSVSFRLAKQFKEAVNG